MKNYSVNLLFVYRFRSLFLLLFALVGNNFYSLATALKHSNQSLIVQKKEAVVRLYEKKRYAKAHAQIELLLPLLQNRLDRSKFEFYQAYCNFYEKRYLVSAHQFHLFVKQYPSFPQVEEAVFMRGYSLACENVDIRLDQTSTHDAIRHLQRYVAAYPTGAYLHKALDALQNLQVRLMEKSFQAAALYVRLGYYKAAIVALECFEETYPDSIFKEKVLRLLIRCHEKLAMTASDEQEKKEKASYSSYFAQQLQHYIRDKKHDALPPKDAAKKSKIDVEGV